MNISDLTDLVLAGVATYGALALCLALLVTALGLPLPSSFLVLAGGAFIRQGVLDLATTLPLALVAVVIGDTLSYTMGRTLKMPIQRRFGGSPHWKRAEELFKQRGIIAIFLTRCILTPVAIPVNLVAGGSGFSLQRFVAAAAIGELVWLLGYGSLGYIFGSQWETISAVITDYSGILVGLLLVAGGGVVLWRMLRPAVVSGARIE
jgi:membrane protein DedA with SNARE-associated domain